MMSEFYVKVVLSTIRRAYINIESNDEHDANFFALLQCNILESFHSLEVQESTLAKSIEDLAQAINLVEEDVNRRQEMKKETEDLEAALLTCRREIYVCFKLLGDLVNAGYALPETALNIIDSLLDYREANHYDLSY